MADNNNDIVEFKNGIMHLYAKDEREFMILYCPWCGAKIEIDV